MRGVRILISDEQIRQAVLSPQEMARIQARVHFPGFDHRKLQVGLIGRNEELEANVYFVAQPRP